MASTNMQNMSVNSWKSIPKQERTRHVLQLQEDNNKLAMEIDNYQKDLVEMRKEIPEECRKMFEEEKRTLLRHFTTAELVPEVPKVGFGVEETQRMTKNIKERVQEIVADCKETRSIMEKTEEIELQHAVLRDEILARSEKLLQKLKN